MPRARFLAPWKNSPTKPSLYHCISRIVDRRFVLNENEREHFRKFMRMQENFSGCRILSYCLMSNHFHLLLEVPPFPATGLTDDERAIISQTLNQARTTFTAKPDDAKALILLGATPPDPSLPAPDLATWTLTASQILNLDETLTR